MQPSIVHTTGVGNSSKPTNTTSTMSGRLLTSGGTRGLPYSVGLNQYPQTHRPQQQPIRTVSYYSTLNAANNSGPQNGRAGGGVYPDVAQDVMQPPRQFDSYYYHPATLNHSQTSVPIYTGPYRQRPSDNVIQQTNSQATRGQPVKKISPQYNDMNPMGVPQYQTTNGRPRNSTSNGASTEYAILQFNPSNVGKEIDV